MILLLAGCALRHHPHYEPVAFALAPYDPTLVDGMATQLDQLRDRSIGSIRTADGALVDDLDTLPPQVVWAAWSTALRWARGAELDLLVQQMPVTVWWSVDRDLTVAWSDARVWRAPTGVTSEWLVDTYGIGGVFDGDRRWGAAELATLDLALSLLTEDELPAVQGVRFVRDALSTRGVRELAWYDPTDEPPQISIFDAAFDIEADGFVGPVDAPLPSGVASILHEIGHALADLEARDAWLRCGAARVGGDREERRSACRAYSQVRRRGPTIDAWQAFRDGRPGPSSFGFRNPHESYAEAFALAHVDPDALERALDGASSWFDPSDTR
ncbi:MAG: hypothetical protein KC621_35320 [Myxococcales bacterium]|nr:hypothetical protein [Myxococcales bacterium]